MNKFKKIIRIIWLSIFLILICMLCIGWENPEVHEGISIIALLLAFPVSLIFHWVLGLFNIIIPATLKNEIVFLSSLFFISFIQWCIILPWIVKRAINKIKAVKHPNQ